MSKSKEEESSLGLKTQDWRTALDLAKLSFRLSGQAARGILPAGIKHLVQKGNLRSLPKGVAGRLLADSLQNSGPVFIKIGQILATREDLLGSEVCGELERLYSKQGKLPRSAIEKILKKKFGRRGPFKNISKHSISVGSIGAVFTAELRTGQKVVLKMLRPSVESDVHRDVQILRLLLKVGIAIKPEWRSTKRLLERSLDDLELAFRRELNLDLELKSLTDFREKLVRNDRVYFPKPYPEFSDQRILVLEHIEGVPLNEWRKSGAATAEKKKVAEIALQEVLKQVFYEGRYHGDPHAGNILVMADGRLAFIDFGLVGEFNDRDRSRIVRAMKAVVSRDADKVVSALLEFGELPADFDRQKFKSEISKVIWSHKDRVAAQLVGGSGAQGEALEALVSELFQVSDRHGIYVPSEVSVLIKTLVTIEGVARSIDPELNILKVASPVLLGALTPKWLRGVERLWKWK